MAYHENWDLRIVGSMLIDLAFRKAESPDKVYRCDVNGLHLDAGDSEAIHTPTRCVEQVPDRKRKNYGLCRSITGAKCC